MSEIWKPIAGYGDKYQASNTGKIRSLDYNKTKKAKNLKTWKNESGYHLVSLSFKGKVFRRVVHVLIAETFFGKKRNGLDINHKDYNKGNNHIENLEFVTRSQNHLHKYLRTGKRGVHFIKKRNVFRAQIKYKGKNIFLGRFKDKEKAYQAYYDKYIEIYDTKPW